MIKVIDVFETLFNNFAINDMKQSENFEVYYHPSPHTRLFLLAFESLEKAVGLILNSHDTFVKVNKNDVKYPYIAINNKNHEEEEMNPIFFCRPED